MIQKPDVCPSLIEMRKYFNFYQTNILPRVQLCSTQNPNGCHALDKHTSAVVFRGIDYALSLGENPIPVIFAGAFHDMARKHDGFDISHGVNAVPNAQKIMNKFPKNLYELSVTEKNRIIFAIINHTNDNISAPDYVSECLWDADRTRMSWEYGFNAKYFNTERAKYVASHPAVDYINFQKLCFPDLIWSREY